VYAGNMIALVDYMASDKTKRVAPLSIKQLHQDGVSSSHFISVAIVAGKNKLLRDEGW